MNRRSKQTSRGANRAMGALVVMGVMAAGMWALEAEAATPIEEPDDLVELCELGPPELETDDSERLQRYHEQRRQAIHETYRVRLPAFDDQLLDYDRVGGLLTISGFRNYQPYRGGPAMRFRNESMLSFEFDEQRAHDLMARIRMGTVEVRVGIAPVAHGDYDTDFCPVDDSQQPQRRLDVDLLYAQLVDTESSESEGGQVLGSYQTRFGHRWMLRYDGTFIDGVGSGVPQVEVSDVQWRPTGQSWEDDFGEDGLPEEVEAVESQLRTALERVLYPCYLQALSTNASLQGAIVVEIPCRDDIDIEARFLMDTIREYPIRHCFQDRIERIDGVGEATSFEAVDALKATILLRRN